MSAATSPSASAEKSRRRRTTADAVVIIDAATRRWHESDGGGVGEDGGVRQSVSVDQRFVHFEECLIAGGPDPSSPSTEFGADARHRTGTSVP